MASYATVGREVTETEGAVCTSSHAKGQGKMTVWLMHSGITRCTHKCEPRSMYVCIRTKSMPKRATYYQPEAHTEA